MANNRAFDSFERDDMAWPYAPNAGPLINKAYFTGGTNTYVSWGGTLRKRLGVLDAGVARVAGVYPSKLWIYETLEASPVVYVVGSFLNGSVYELRYTLISSLGAWTTVTERRGCNHSRWPHEGAVRRGKLYIKGFPALNVDTENLGSIYLDGSGGSMATHDWGALPPSVPVALDDPASWNASAHSVNVLNSWIYTYTWEKVSGQETNQAPLETNPDDSPSATGPFSNLIPSMTVQGHADTTEYPFINIYRTTDGGGSFYFVKQITNTGAGNITFEDKYLASGSGDSDPLPDAQLDTQHVAPSTTSNSPPPAVPLPLVTGTDEIQRSTPIFEYASRLWYGINEYLFYSANEELDEGVPEESYPSGEANPNFFRMRQGIMNLIETPDGLLTMTRKETVRTSGTSKSTFNPRPFLGNVGAASGQPRAICAASEYVAWLTQDYRVAIAHGDSFAILSNPINNDIKTAATAGGQIEFTFWTEGDKEWLIVAAHFPDDTNDSRWFVYDLDRSRRVQDDFWFVPWYVKSTALVAGATSATAADNKLLVALWDGSNFLLGKLDDAWQVGYDIDPTSGAHDAVSWSTKISLTPCPLGDHVNALRRPDFSVVVAGFSYERTSFDGDNDPTVKVYYDNLGSVSMTLAAPTAPPRRIQSSDYKTCQHQDAFSVAKHVAFEWLGVTDTLPAEIQQCWLSFLPDSGS